MLGSYSRRVKPQPIGPISSPPGDTSATPQMAGLSPMLASSFDSPLPGSYAPSAADGASMLPSLMGLTEQAPRPQATPQMNGWRMAAGAIGDALARQNGGVASFAPALQQHREQEALRQRQEALWGRENTQRQEDHRWTVESEARKAAQPQFFMAGDDRVRYDPTSGQATTIYDAPTAAEAYAAALGVKQGTPEYTSALRDFVLRGNGPTALAGRVDLEGVRQNYRVGLEGVKQGNRASLRSTPTYAQAHPRSGGMMGSRGGGPKSPSAVVAPIVAKMASGQPLSSGEQQALDYYRRPTGSGRAPAASGSVPRISSQADYARLQKGASYIAPDGSRRVKP